MKILHYFCNSGFRHCSEEIFISEHCLKFVRILLGLKIFGAPVMSTKACFYPEQNSFRFSPTNSYMAESLTFVWQQLFKVFLIPNNVGPSVSSYSKLIGGDAVAEVSKEAAVLKFGR